MEDAVNLFIDSSSSYLNNLKGLLQNCVPKSITDKQWHVGHICRLLLRTNVLKLKLSKHGGFWKCLRTQIRDYLGTPGDFIVSIDSKCSYRISHFRALVGMISVIFDRRWYGELSSVCGIPKNIITSLILKDGFRDFLFTDICGNCSDKIDIHLLCIQGVITKNLYSTIIQEVYDRYSLCYNDEGLNPTKRRKTNNGLFIGKTPDNKPISDNVENNRQEMERILCIYFYLKDNHEFLMKGSGKYFGNNHSNECRCIDLLEKLPIFFNLAFVMTKCSVNGISLDEVIQTNNPVITNLKKLSKLFSNCMLGNIPKEMKKYSNNATAVINEYEKFDSKKTLSNLECIRMFEIPMSLLRVDIDSNICKFGSGMLIDKFVLNKNTSRFIAYGIDSTEASYLELVSATTLIQDKYGGVWPLLQETCILQTAENVYVVSVPETMTAMRMLLMLERNISSMTTKHTLGQYTFNILLRNMFMSYNIRAYSQTINDIACYCLVTSLAFYIGSTYLVRGMKLPSDQESMNLYRQLPYVCHIWRESIHGLIDEKGNKNEDLIKDVNSIGAFIGLKYVHGISATSIEALYYRLIVLNEEKKLEDNEYAKVCLWGSGIMMEGLDMARDNEEIFKLYNKGKKFNVPFDHIAVYNVITNPNLFSEEWARDIMYGITIINKNRKEIKIRRGMTKGIGDIPRNLSKSYMIEQFWSKDEVYRSLQKKYEKIRVSKCVGNSDGVSDGNVFGNIAMQHFDTMKHVNGFHFPKHEWNEKVYSQDEIEATCIFVQTMEAFSFHNQAKTIDMSKVPPVYLNKLMVSGSSCYVPICNEPMCSFENCFFVPRKQNYYPSDSASDGYALNMVKNYRSNKNDPMGNEYKIYLDQMQNACNIFS